MFIQAFFEGILAALGSLMLGQAVLLLLGQFEVFFLIAVAAIEELLKFLFIFHSRLRTENKRKILYAAPFVGIGFFSVEFFLKNPAGNEAILWVPFLGIFLVHFVTTFIYGYFTSRRYALGLLGNSLLLSFNIALHFCYNYFLSRS